MRKYVVMITTSIVVVFASVIGVVAAGWKPVLGLDLQGGISVVLAPVGETNAESLNKAVDIIRTRVDAIGVAEPEISRQGKNIVVDLPGVKDRDKARGLVGQTAELRFRQVLAVLPPADTSSTTTTTTTTTTPTTVPAEGATTTTTVPATQTTTAEGITPRELDIADQPVVLPGRQVGKDPAIRYSLGPTELTGTAVKTADATFESGAGWGVTVEFTQAGLAGFNAMAAKYFSQPAPMNSVAFVLDSVVQSAPAFQTNSFDGQVRISGDFSKREAQDLAIVLRYGALPVQLEELNVANISPTLGSDQLDAGLIAGAIGVGLVLLYMLVLYRGLGLIAWFGLGLTFAFTYALVCWLGHTLGLTLTLAGVTGLIVSVGVTVDSYIVYFERLKDEVRSGRTIRSSVDRGFKQSWRTIVAADIVSLIGAVVLYLLAVGSVRGFAFFLGLSTLVDLLVSYFVMHPLVVMLARRQGLVRARWIGLRSGLDAETATL